MKKPRKNKFDFRDEIPYAVINWLILAWFVIAIFSSFAVVPEDSRLKPFIEIGSIALLISISILIFILCFRGTRLSFLINPRTDSDGWVMRTQNKLKVMAKRLAYNYPELIKRIHLKDSTFRVKIVKRYKYHENPITIDEVESYSEKIKNAL